MRGASLLVANNASMSVCVCVCVLTLIDYKFHTEIEQSIDRHQCSSQLAILIATTLAVRIANHLITHYTHTHTHTHHRYTIWQSDQDKMAKRGKKCIQLALAWQHIQYSVQSQTIHIIQSHSVSVISKNRYKLMLFKYRFFTID